MEELIEQYLFQHNKCPLPLVGTLQIKEGKAVAWHGDNKLSAPVPQIELIKRESPADQFIAFIALQKKVSLGEASLLLQKYCVDLQKLNAYKEMKLEQAGRFFVDQSGELVFKQESLPKEFFPTVSVQRVTHSKTISHAIRVGDRETTNEVMTEFYSEKEKVKKERWWIAAILLGVVAAAILFFYFKDHGHTDKFGNTTPVTTTPTEQTYRSN